ncbi:MAG: sulfatase-like hydrolase/transferase [Bacteroidales bacterium]|jgi:phosphoglycerol transferase MdoB-like AlkP superfamily enzyme|nr:sulfatase-like hydrolase/transferase [Bacteroidales bacterium]
MKIQKSVILKFFLAFFLLLLTQVAMYFFNTAIFSIDSFSDFLSILLGSIRFALSSVALYLYPYLFFALLPLPIRQNKWYKAIENFLYILGVNLMMILNLIDVGYYKFTFKRISYDFFNYLGVGGDFKELIPQFAKDYWHIILIFVILNIILFYFYRRINRKYGSELIIANRKWYIKNIAFFVIFGSIAFLFQRGGIQLRPLSVVHANYYASSQNTALVLNTPFTLYRSWGRVDLEKKQYFPSQKDLEKYYNPIIKPEKILADTLFNEPLSVEKTNVVVIILESFSEEYLLKYTPFLSSLAKRSIVFEGYANGKRSIDGLPSVLSSLPLLSNESFITSQYGSDNISSFASLLKKFNYKTSFFHGGYNGTMGFDAFTKNVGYDNYFGRTQYNNDKDYDGKWGIFDEPFLQYMVNKLDEYKEPFTSAVFTLSSHHPYTIPLQHKNRFPKGTMIVHETVGYADYALKRFFEKAKEKSWYENTLFIITADHSAITEFPQYRTLMGTFRIPIIFFHPKLKHGIKVEKFMQQIDILPSAMSLIHYPYSFISFGQNIFSNDENYYILYLNGEYIFREGNYVLKYNDDITPTLYYLPNDPNCKKDISSSNKERLNNMTLKTKAIIEQYNSRLIENNLIIN